MTPDELRIRRNQLGLTQAKLAALIGVTQHTISRWEEGKIKLTAPRALWLDLEIKRVERNAQRRQPRPLATGDVEGGT